MNFTQYEDTNFITSMGSDPQTYWATIKGPTDKNTDVLEFIVYEVMNFTP